MLSNLGNLLQVNHVNYFLLFAGSFLVSYFIVVPIMFFYVYKYNKEKWAHLKIQKEFPAIKNILNDVGWSTVTIVIWTFFAWLILLLISKGYTNVYLSIHERSTLYFIFTIFLFSVLWDTYFYWAHKLMHSGEIIYKYTHATHHKTTNPTPFSIFSFNPLEAIIFGIYFVLICFSIPVNIYAVIVVFLINVLANIIGHLGYEFVDFKLSKKLDVIFINSIHHNVHHKYGYSNYGLYFPFWDKIMGTFHHKYKEDRDNFYKENHGE